MIVKPWE